MRSTAPLLSLALFLTGCASDMPVRAIKCPPLKPPALATIATLERACKAGDTATCDFAVALEAHYRKLDACGG